MQTIEYQPHIFDDECTAELRLIIEKNRRSFFVRQNVLYKEMRELKDELDILKRNICQGEK